MAVILIKAIFFALSALSNLLTRAIFTAAAHVLVQIIQVLKVPGEGSQRVMEQVRNTIKTCLEYLSGLIIEAFSAVVCSVFDLVKEGIVNSLSGFAAAVAGLLEKSKTSMDGLVENIPEILNAFSEMIGKILSDFLNNCNGAMTYVYENVLN